MDDSKVPCQMLAVVPWNKSDPGWPLVVAVAEQSDWFQSAGDGSGCQSSMDDVVAEGMSCVHCI